MSDLNQAAAPYGGGLTFAQAIDLFYKSREEMNLRTWTLSHYLGSGKRLALEGGIADDKTNQHDRIARYEQ